MHFRMLGQTHHLRLGSIRVRAVHVFARGIGLLLSVWAFVMFHQSTHLLVLIIVGQVLMSLALWWVTGGRLVNLKLWKKQVPR